MKAFHLSWNQCSLSTACCAGWDRADILIAVHNLVGKGSALMQPARNERWKPLSLLRISRGHCPVNYLQEILLVVRGNAAHLDYCGGALLLRNGSMSSIGSGKIVVELFSEAISLRVCRKRSCNAAGVAPIMLAA